MASKTTVRTLTPLGTWCAARPLSYQDGNQQPKTASKLCRRAGPLLPGGSTTNWSGAHDFWDF